MFYIFLLIILAIDFFISWGNARYVGENWAESKIVKGGFRVYVVSGYIVSIAGFTMVYSYIAILIVPYILLLTNMKDSTILQIQELSGNLIYVILVISIIPAGFFICIKSLQNFWRQKNLRNGLLATWNTCAEMHNVINAAIEMPSVLGKIGKALFGGKDKKNKKVDTIVIAVAIYVCVCAILGGYCTASAIKKKAEKESTLLDDLKRYNN